MFSSLQRSGEVRPPAVAGQFYPAESDALRTLVAGLLAEASGHSGQTPKALIAPHAGYAYSGPIAASAYATLAGARHVRRIVLVGPSHFVAFKGLAAPSAKAFQTPLGEIPVDTEAMKKLEPLAQFRIYDGAHAPEHSLEVQLPFLQTQLGAFSIVPLLTGIVSYEGVAEVLDLLWGPPETILIASSDLSHFLDAQTARGLDRSTANAIVRMAPGEIPEHGACGHRAVSGLITVCHRRGLHCQLLDLRNSSDTAGSPDRVVGYGAFSFS